MNGFYDLEKDFTADELNQLVKQIKKKKENEKVKEVKCKNVYPKIGGYNKSKTLYFFKDCLLIKIGTIERRKTVHE